MVSVERFLLSEHPFVIRVNAVFIWLFRIIAIAWLVFSAFYILYLLLSSVVEVIEFFRFRSFKFFFPRLLSNLIKITIYSSFILVCYLFLTYREEYKKYLKYFSLIVFGLHLFPLTVVIFSIIEKTKDIEIDIPWIFNEWIEYRSWFLNIPETSFWWAITFSAICSITISYISLCVYSDKYCIPFSEKIKKCWLKINLYTFWLLFLVYPVFQVYCNLSYCSSYGYKFINTPLKIVSHYIGIYGFLSSPATECEVVIPFGWNPPY